MENLKLKYIYDLINSSKLDGLILNPGSSLFYLTNLDFHLMERPVLLFLVRGQNPVLVLPELEAQKLKQSAFPAQAITYDDNPATWSETIKKAAKFLCLEGKRLGVEPTCIRFLEMDLLTNSIPNISFVSAEDLLSTLRICKTESEITAMQKAVNIAQDALLKTIPLIQKGKTEKEISNQLVINLLKSGSQPNLPFMPIVSTGTHSADPHAVPTDTILKAGDLLVIDWGARYDGYISDLTRTFAIESLNEKFKDIGISVAKANQIGCGAIRPGVIAGKIDDLVRQSIQIDGYAQYFTHRTGHGIGLDPHESPYIFAENSLILEPGMTFTVEPGVYLPETGGVRIEDNVVVTENGVQVLSSLSREIIVLA